VKTSLTHVPSDVLLVIFQYLDSPADIAAVGQTCKKLASTVTQEGVWMSACEKMRGRSLKGAPLRLTTVQSDAVADTSSTKAFQRRLYPLGGRHAIWRTDYNGGNRILRSQGTDGQHGVHTTVRSC
jgi:hypothetical protein